MSVKVGSVEGKLEGDRSKVRFVQTNMGASSVSCTKERRRG